MVKSSLVGDIYLDKLSSCILLKNKIIILPVFVRFIGLVIFSICSRWQRRWRLSLISIGDEFIDKHTFLLLSLNEAYIQCHNSFALNYKTQIIVPKSNNTLHIQKMEIKRSLEISLHTPLPF